METDAIPQKYDRVLLDISRDVTLAQARFAVLRQPVSRGRPSERQREVPSSSSSSTASDESDESDEQEEVVVDIKGKGKEIDGAATPRPSKSFTIRRAAFARINRLRRQHDTRTSAGLSESPSQSPKITLTGDHSPPPIFKDVPDSPEVSPAPAMQTPQLSLSFADDRDAGKAKAPITLLASRNIPPIGSVSHLPDTETHGDAICRLLILFTMANPQWSYQQNLVDIAIHLYLVYLQKPSRSSGSIVESNTKGAEDQTYWAFCALVRELGPIVVGQDQEALSKSLECLGRRARWADEPLCEILVENGLDPSTPIFASRWMTLLLLRDLPRDFASAAWDYVISNTSVSPADTLDALVDVCAAALMVSRPILLSDAARSTSPRKSKSARGLWTEGTVSEGYDAERQLRLLRRLPLDSFTDPSTFLRVAANLRDARVVEKVPQLAFDYVLPASASTTWSDWGSARFKQVNEVVTSAASVAASTATTAAATAAPVVSSSANTAWSTIGSWIKRKPTAFHPQSPDMPRPSSPASDRSGSARSPREVSPDLTHSPERIYVRHSGSASPRSPPAKRSIQGPRPLLLPSKLSKVDGEGVRE